MKDELVVTVYFAKAKPIAINELTFDEIIESVLKFDNNGKQPIYIECEKSKILYNRSVYKSFSKGEIDYRELLHRFTIDGVCRNKVSLQVYGVEIDPLSLWWRKKDQLYLADDDQYIEYEYDSELFTNNI